MVGSVVLLPPLLRAFIGGLVGDNVFRAIKRKGTKVDAKAWLASALPAVPNATLPDPAKYDSRTWENVVYEGNLAAGIFLAMFFEHKSKEQPRDAVALNEVSTSNTVTYTAHHIARTPPRAQPAHSPRTARAHHLAAFVKDHRPWRRPHQSARRG